MSKPFRVGTPFWKMGHRSIRNRVIPSYIRHEIRAIVHPDEVVMHRYWSPKKGWVYEVDTVFILEHGFREGWWFKEKPSEVPK